MTMSNSITPPIGTEPFRISSVLFKSGSVYLDRFFIFFVVALSYLLPEVLMQFAFGVWPMQITHKPAAVPDFRGFWAHLISLPLTIIGTSMLIVLSFQKLDGQASHVGAAFRQALSRFFSVLGIFLLTGVFIMIGAVLGMVVAVAVHLALSHFFPVVGDFPLAGVSFTIGFALSVALVILVACMFCVATPASLGERLGPWTSIQRSRELSRGERWRIFGLSAIVFLPISLLGFAAPFGVARGLSSVAVSLALFGVSLISTPFITAVYTVLFRNLRIAKEGV